jgi:uroporphyrinogen decarboxylase
MRALAFEPPDTVPTFENFWEEFTLEWRRQKGFSPEGGDPRSPRGAPKDWDIFEYYGVDVRVAAADETPWPSGAQSLSSDGVYTRQRDGWGRTSRTREGSYFSSLESPGMAPDNHDVGGLEFEPADADGRYAEFEQVVAVERERRCVFAKVGGPFIRLSFVRGMEQWLLDLAAEQDFARELVERMVDHHIAIGLESLQRGNLWSTGIWIFDDMCSQRGPMMSPRTFERVFLPAYVRMIDTFKSAGARYVCLHCDGDLRPLLPMLVEAGIDAINPVQYSSGMKVGELREQYGDRLAYVGGVDNVQIMTSGTDREFTHHMAELSAWAQEGGVVLGSHSIGVDIRIDRYEAYHSTIRPGWSVPAWDTRGG